eukprot:m.88519 g.88519  ORF g.88519 m.88519 type:complete len:502 (-) comp26207_c0_seq1:362-1867(-)
MTALFGGFGRIFANRAAVYAPCRNTTIKPVQTTINNAVTQRFASNSANPKVLVLGAGMVVPPLVEYLGSVSALKPLVSIVDVDLTRSKDLAQNYSRVHALDLNVNDNAALDAAIKEHDLVISLLPVPMHPMIAKRCIKNKVNMVTASYVSDAMQDLHESALDAGITILNEVGLDPGIDHLGAMKIIDDVKQRGGKIKSFVSYCGGLPAAEDSFVPLQYKFSWSPRGVFSAGLSQATYKRNGKIITTELGHLFNYAEPVHMFPSLNLEGYPNRNSLVYLDAYGIEGCETILRGTLRYEGFAVAMAAMQMLGLFSQDVSEKLKPGAPPITWVEIVAQLLSTTTTDQTQPPRIQLAHHLAAKGYSEKDTRHISQTMERLGLFSDQVAPQSSTILDALAKKLEYDLRYQAGERDMVLLSHEFIAEWADGTKSQINSTLVKTGTPSGETAMALTVGLPCALGAELVLNNTSLGAGVIRPLKKDYYEPILEKLATYGIAMKDEEFEL